MRKLIDKLEAEKKLSFDEFVTLINGRTPDLAEYLFERARAIRHAIYGKDVYIRGLIEVSSYCKNDCLYCGLRRSNKNAERYRLNEEQILSSCENGYKLGFRTFVMQGGEDLAITDDMLVSVIEKIRITYPDCAITLSLGEKSYESYKRLYDAGANRYLLRHETAVDEHYAKLHPPELSLKTRKQCLYDLRDIGYQVGSGFMVGSPWQTTENLAEDMLFLADLKPHMVGIGPFISHHDTPFADKQNGSVELTLFMLGLLRLMLPNLLIPATTALGTISESGREKGILAGANVIMPNLSPADVRKKYLIYDNKINTGIESAEGLEQLKKQMQKIGYQIVVARGDCKGL